MNEHPIDDLFRKGLGKYQAPAPPSAWQRIAADQAKKRRGQFVRRASLSLAVLFSLLGLAYYLLSSVPESSPNVPATAVAIDSPIEPGRSLPDSPSAPAAEVGLGPAANQEINMLVAKGTSIDTQDTAPNSKQISAANKQNSRDSRAGEALQQAAITSISFQAEIPELQDESQVIPAAPFASRALRSLSDLPSDALVANSSSVAAVEHIYTLPLPRLAPYQRPLPQPSFQEVTAFRKSVRAHWEVELLTGFAYAHQSLKAKAAEDRNDLGTREISEFPGASMLNSLLLSYRQPNGLGFRSGISYTLLRNRFEYEQQRLLEPDSLQTLFIKSSNRIRMLEVPLLLSYELPGKRFHLALNAGPIVNVSTAAKGRYLTASQQAPLLLEEEKIYRANVGISWQAGFTATYDLGGGNSLLIEPSFRSFPQTFTRATYNLRETYWLAGLQLGLRHKL